MLSYVDDQFAQVAIAVLVYRQTQSAFLTALAYALTLPGEKFVIGSAVGNMIYQASQVLGFVVVALLNPYRTLASDAATFGISALMVLTRGRPGPRGPCGIDRHRPWWTVSVDGIRIVFSDRFLLTLLLFGWLAGFTSSLRAWPRRMRTRCGSPR